MTKTAFIFAIDDTLYDQSIPVCSAIAEVTGKMPDDPELFYRTFHSYSNTMFRRTERNRMDLNKSRILRIQYTMEDLGQPVSDREAEMFQHCYMENLRKVQLSPTLTQLMDRCVSAGVKMGILTNGPYEHQLGKYMRLGLARWIPRRNVVVSEEAGFAKPSVEIYHVAQMRMGLVPENTWMIGDSLVNDIAGASAAGWHTLWYSHHGQEPGEICPERTVYSEEEMLDWAENSILS